MSKRKRYDGATFFSKHGEHSSRVSWLVSQCFFSTRHGGGRLCCVCWAVSTSSFVCVRVRLSGGSRSRTLQGCVWPKGGTRSEPTTTGREHTAAQGGGSHASWYFGRKPLFRSRIRRSGNEGAASVGDGGVCPRRGSWVQVGTASHPVPALVVMPKHGVPFVFVFLCIVFSQC